MADQGCPNEGSDSRLFGKWGCRIQSALSWRSTVEPLSVLVAFPPYLAVNVPLPFTPKHRRYLHVRVGWRFDKSWGYIFDPAIKVKEVAILY